MHAHYNNLYQREQLGLFDNVAEDKRANLLTFVNAAIHPYDFTTIYNRLHEPCKQNKMLPEHYAALKGVLLAMLVKKKRKNAWSFQSVDYYVIDFIKLIKVSTLDAERFLLNMSFYFYRFLFAEGLRVAFGYNYLDIVESALPNERRPNPRSFHYTLCNQWLRTATAAYAVFKQFRQTHDEGFQEGVNDLDTVLAANQYKAALGAEAIEKVFYKLMEKLPSASLMQRRKAWFAIDNCQDGWYIINSDWYEKNYLEAYNKPLREEEC
jgi:hypothetical protein